MTPRPRPGLVRIAELCAGYGGLGMAVRDVLGGEVAWVADNDPDVSVILAHRFPSAPNYGDITTADWAAVEPVDVLTAGFPCQDVSCAGGRAGLREGNRTGVWAHVARAVDELRPSLVVLENVRGLLSAGADSDVEPCPWCVGEAGNEHPLRALGAVLGDLADLGYDVRWAVVSAAGAGAPHRRERVFILGWPAADADDDQQDEPAGADRSADEWAAARRPVLRAGGRAAADTECATGARLADASQWRADRRAPADGHRSGTRPGIAPEDADGATGGERRLAAPGQAAGGRSRADAGRPGGTPAPADAASPRRDRSEDTRADRSDARPLRSGRVEPERGGIAPADPGGARLGQHPGEPPAEEAGPFAGDEPSGDRGLRPAPEWGPYAFAIRRWERATGRPAPRPTEPGRTGERLSPRFVEWMQGLPEGWVTGVPGLSRNAQLKALGNGVVPAQAALALRMLLDRAGAVPSVPVARVAG